MPQDADATHWATQWDEPKAGAGERPAVILVESSLLLREGLLGILRPAAFRVVAAVPTPEAALTALDGPLTGQRIDLLLCSLEPRQDVPALLEAVAALQRRGAIARTVLLLPACSPADLVLAVLGGADGVILKDISGERLLRALDLVLHGQDVLPLGGAAQMLASCHAAPPAPVAVPAGPSSALPSATRTPNLSDRERQILRCLVEGCANKLIARRLLIAEATVKVHIKGLLRKINVSNRTQAAIWALNHGATARGMEAPPSHDDREDEPGLPARLALPPPRPGTPLLRAVS